MKTRIALWVAVTVCLIAAGWVGFTGCSKQSGQFNSSTGTGLTSREAPPAGPMDRARVSRRDGVPGGRTSSLSDSQVVLTESPISRPAEVADAADGQVAAPEAEPEAKPEADDAGVHHAQDGPWNREGYDHIVDNPFRRVTDHPLSTFSIDVDTASYANTRRYLLQMGQLPPAGAVRVEEFINYFRYDYEPPTGEHPFAVRAELASCPWNDAHRLARIALKGRVIADEERPPMNLVFLLDVSGSMSAGNKLPLVKRAMKTLLGRLDERDRVAIAVYAGAAGLVLDSTRCDSWPKRDRIIPALDRLSSGGSTNGGAGIHLAYGVAKEHFIEGGVNRVILCTDGDFNVGTTSRSSLVDLVTEKAREGVFLTVLGFGMGNYQDATLEQIADKGNGNYGYVDDIREAEKLLSHQMMSTCIAIAKDVKIQVEFNPAKVAGYRLIGYENRMLRKEDFNDDKKDAGEIGAGHTVTALYEIVPAGLTVPTGGSVDPLKYARPVRLTDAAEGDECMTVKLRYKQPDGDTSTLMSFPVSDEGRRIDDASNDFRWAAAVASFGMILRDSPHKGSYTLAAVEELAEPARGTDEMGYRAELLQMVRVARELTARQARR